MLYKDKMKEIAEKVQPMPSRDMSKTHPRFQYMAAALEKYCLIQFGIVIKWNNLLRSWRYQDDLFAQGRTKPGKIVTDARGGFSAHNLGLAGDFYIDSFPGKKKGDSIYPTKQMNQVIAAARKMGFTSGSDWGDSPHLQIVTEAMLKKIVGGSEPKL